MRKSRDLLGLPVMDVNAGKIVGRIRQIVFFPREKCIVGFIIGGKWWQDKLAVTFDQVLSLGNDAVTLGDVDAIRKLNRIPELHRLLHSRVSIYNADILTVSGRHLGTVDELLIGDDGRITHLVVSEGMWRDWICGARMLSTNYVRAIGEDAIIVEDAAEMAIVEDVADSQENSNVSLDDKIHGEPKSKSRRMPDAWFGRLTSMRNILGFRKEPESVSSERQSSAEDETVSVESSASQGEVAELERLWMRTVHRAQNVSELVGGKVVYLCLEGRDQATKGEDLKDSNDRELAGISRLWEYWQEKLEAIKRGIEAKNAEYLVGKMVERTVTDGAGHSIINAGETVTPEVIESAQQKGRLYHLALSCAVKEVDDKMAAVRSRVFSKPSDEK